MKYGKKYSDSLKSYERTKSYEAGEAMGLVLANAKAKFDETVELHVRLGIDPRQADQQVRGVLVLPNGTGKTKKVLVIAKGERKRCYSCRILSRISSAKRRMERGRLVYSRCLQPPRPQHERGSHCRKEPVRTAKNVGTFEETHDRQVLPDDCGGCGETAVHDTGIFM